MKKPELLAPVGGKEALIAAIDNGADAVYFGGEYFSARHFAFNFTDNEIEWAIDYAHIRGVRAYVTVNTLIKNAELEKAGEYLQFLCNAGADAVIIQDMGILRLLREQLPSLPIHASTQMTIHNIEGVKFLEEMGVKRVVLARELSLLEIQRIRSQTSIEIENFIHGALCFSYSGQCLLSSMIGGRSGNRGYCAQPCRKKYSIGKIEGYLLSPRDLNMSEHIGDLLNAGIDSFKIEGRMKRPEYVAGVVRVYRQLIDRYLAAPRDFHVTKDEKHMLLQLFNREFTTGYFFGNPGSELLSREYPHNRGTELGKVIDFDEGTKSISIHLKALLRTGDGIGIWNRETGIIVMNMYSGRKSVTEAASGSFITIPVDIEASEATEGESIFKTFDSKLMRSLEIVKIKKIPIRMSFKARIGEPVTLLIEDDDNKVEIQGEIVTSAKTKPVSKDSISEQLCKLGGTIFEANKVDFDLDDNIFIPVSELNLIRRSAINELEKIRANKWKRQCIKPVITTGAQDYRTKPVLAVNTTSIESFKAAVDSGAEVVYAGLETIGMDVIEYAHQKGVKVIIRIPAIEKDLSRIQANPDYRELIEASDGFLAGNPGAMYHLQKNFPNSSIIADYSLNVMNSLTLDHFLEYCRRITLSPELTLKEISGLARSGPVECIVHGFFPLMVSEHDLIADFYDKKPDHIFLKDEKGFRFEIRNGPHDRTYLMNSRELCLLESVHRIIKAKVGCLRIEAGTYDSQMTARITREYREAIDDASGGKESKKICIGKHTTGHYFRGVL